MSWRFDDSIRLFEKPKVNVGDLWPDVDKSIIYQSMLDYGVDAKEIPVSFTSQDDIRSVMAMGIDPDGHVKLWVATDSIDEAYPGDEAKYIGLVHELAHFRQAIVGSLGPPSAKLWFEQQHEQEAIRWSARQARLMGWSQRRLKEFLERRYHHRSQAWLERVVREGGIGFRIHPRQETLDLLGRRPVRVHRYRRRR